jgi:hypothetical protein
LLVIPQIVSIGSPLDALSTSSSARSISALSAGGLTALDAPVRLLNTRTSGIKVGTLDGRGEPFELSVAGIQGIPSSGVSAVAMNVTVVDGEAADSGGFVTVYPCGTRPDASNLNFVNGQTVPNAVIAPLSADGKVCFYVYGKAHLLGDVSAYFTAGFTALTTPKRVVNTRDFGVKVTNGSIYQLILGGQGVLPAAATTATSSLAMNVTVVDGEAGDSGGYVTVYPCGTRPDASNLNFVNGQTVPNAVIAPVSADGSVCFFVSGKAHLLVDVSGYFDSSLSSLAAPTRLLNTRTSGIKVGALDGRGEPYELSVAGVQGVPASGVAAVAMNVTVVDGEAGNAGGYVTVYPCGTRPDSSNLNFVNGQTVPNAVIAPLSVSGKVCFYVYGKAHLLVDVSGYFGGSGGGTGGDTGGGSGGDTGGGSGGGTGGGSGGGDTGGGSGGGTGGGLPAPTTNYGLTSVLSTQQGRWTDFQALQGSTTLQAMSLNDRRVPLVAGSMTFRTTNVVGLALPDTVSPGSSGLLAVSAAGIATDALTSGTATISKFYTAPNGKYYVLFSGTAELVPGGPQCLLAEVEQSTGIPTCVDGSLNSITWQGLGTERNSPIQFDSSGAVYYQGTTSSGNTVVRKWSNGVGADLINQNVVVMDFLVLDDGVVLLSGYTVNSSAQWVRKISVNGGITNLASTWATSMSKFVDGNVYIGLWGGNLFGVKRYLTQTGQLESKFWISGNTNGVEREAYFNADTICANGERLLMEGFCGWYGTIMHGNMSVLGLKNFAFSGARGNAGTVLMQYYPTVERANSIVNIVSIAQRYLTTIVLVGTDASGVNMVTLYETGSKQETILVDQSNEIEIYNMTYVSATNKIMFNGLRFSDNRQVVGEIDLS